MKYKVHCELTALSELPSRVTNWKPNFKLIPVDESKQGVFNDILSQEVFNVVKNPHTGKLNTIYTFLSRTYVNELNQIITEKAVLHQV